MAAHSPVGASGMVRWSNCPGSVRLSKGIESRSSEYAREGTAAHQLAETCLTGDLDPASFLGMPIDIDDGGEPFTVSQEMVDAVNVYLDAISTDGPDFCNLVVEHGFDMADLHEGLYGTADAVMYNDAEDTLFVYDFKYGSGVGVGVYENKQLMYYALGAIRTLTGGATPEFVEMVIVQPRFEHEDGTVRRWRVKAERITKDFRAELLKAVKATEKKNAPLAEGDWCKWCPAAAICPEKRKTSLAVAQQAFAADSEKNIQAYSPDELADWLDKIPQIEDWCKNVRAFAYAEAERGREVPRHKLVDKKPTRVWVEDDSRTSAALQKAFDIADADVYNAPKLKSPAQIEKMIGKSKAAKEKLKSLVVFHSSGTTLVPDSDPRQAIVKSDAAESFAIADLFS